jgi:hypothetical protein
MIKSIKLALGLLTFLLAFPSQHTLARQDDAARSLWQGTVTSNQAALYAGVSTTSKVVTMLGQGDAVTINLEITKEDGKWYSVRTSDQTSAAGYMSGKDLSFEDLSSVAFWEFKPPPDPIVPSETDSSNNKSALASARAARLNIDVKSFLVSKFGRTLPISAFGQTGLHTHLGFDHRNSVDVALHPDSPEGRLLLAKLRSFGVPFIAFRRAVPGIATGAHIHVGNPSPRR